MKAWFLFDEDIRGYVVHAETRNKAKVIGKPACDLFGCDPIDYWTNVSIRRCKELDDKPVTISNLIYAGFDMEYDGEPIDSIDLPCPCEICQHLC